jgi:hypothetical protein
LRRHFADPLHQEIIESLVFVEDKRRCGLCPWPAITTSGLSWSGAKL